MTEEPFLNKLRELNRGAIADDSPIEPRSWDSVDILDLIAVIDEAYSVTVPVDQLTACTTVGELRALVRAATAS